MPGPYLTFYQGEGKLVELVVDTMGTYGYVRTGAHKRRQAARRLWAPGMYN